MFTNKVYVDPFFVFSHTLATEHSRRLKM